MSAQDRGMLAVTVARTKAAREAAAEKTLDWETVAAAIGAASAAGAGRVVLAPAKPVEIKQTEAAANVIWRLEQRGFKTQWLGRRPAPNESEIHDLEVTW